MFKLIDIVPPTSLSQSDFRPLCITPGHLPRGGVTSSLQGSTAAKNYDPAYAKIRNILLLTSSILLLTFSANASLSLTGSAKEIYADEIFFDARSGSMTGRGNAKVTTESGQTIRSDFMSLGKSNGGSEVNLTTTEIFLNPRVRITADEIISTSELTKAFDMTYTACWGCDLGVPAWEFSAAKLVHDRDEKEIYFYSATLYWHGLPIIWLPYFSNPDPSVKRRSGILMPTFGTNNRFGTTFGLPVYIAISDFHDLTLSPTLFTSENPLLKAEHRLNLNHAEFSTTGSYTMNRGGHNRWHVFNRDRIELGDNALLTANVNRVSDKLYLKEYEFYDSQPYLDTTARLEVFGERGYVRTEARSFQELRQSQRNDAQTNGDILPRVHGAMQTEPIIGNSYLNLSADFINLSKSSESDNTTRLIGEAKYTYPFIILIGQKVELSVGTRYDVYQFVNADLLTGENDFTGMKARFLPTASAAISWPLVNNRGGITQIFEPKARIVVMNHNPGINFINQDSSGSLFTDASVFADNRYSGYDLWNDGSFADYGANWSAFDNDGRGVEIFAGQSYDFYAPLNLDPNSGFRYGGSDYVGRLKIQPISWMSLTNRFRSNRDDLAIRHLESDLRMGTRNYVNIGFMHAVQFKNEEAVMHESKFDEVMGGFGIYITERLRVSYNINYNITDNRMQRRGIGMLYDHPCYAINLGFHDDRSQDLEGRPIGSTSFKMQFSLKMQGS